MYKEKKNPSVEIGQRLQTTDDVIKDSIPRWLPTVNLNGERW